MALVIVGSSETVGRAIECTADRVFDVAVPARFLRFDSPVLARSLEGGMLATLSGAFDARSRFRVVPFDPEMERVVRRFVEQRGAGTPTMDDLRELAKSDRTRFVAFPAIDPSEAGCLLSVTLVATLLDTARPAVVFTEQHACDPSIVRAFLTRAPDALEARLCQRVVSEPIPLPGTPNATPERSAERAGWLGSLHDFCTDGLGQQVLCGVIGGSILAGAGYGIYEAAHSGADRPASAPVTVNFP